MSLTVVKASDLADDTFLKKTTVSSVEKFIGTSVSELKTLLGLPKSHYKAVWYQSSTADPIMSVELVNTFAVSPVPVELIAGLFYMSSSFVRTSEGVYTLTPNTLAGLPSSGVADITFQPTDYTDRYMTMDFSGNDIIFTNKEHSDNSVIDGFKFILEIKDWS